MSASEKWTLDDGREVVIDVVRYGTGYTARARIDGVEIGRGWTTRALAPAAFRDCAQDILAIAGNRVAVRGANRVSNIEAAIRDAEMGDDVLQHIKAKTREEIDKLTRARIAYDEHEVAHNQKCEDDSGMAWSC